MTPIETIEYRGEKIEIYQDENAYNPRSWDNLGKMVCWNRRYSLGDEMPKRDPEEYLEGLAMSASPEYEEAKERLLDIEHRLVGWIPGLHPNTNRSVFGHASLFARAEAFVACLKEKALEQYMILPLFLYDHSGLSMSTRSFHDPWDSGQVGFIYCDLDDARKNLQLPDAQWDTKLDGEWAAGRTLRQCTEDVLRGEVEAYDQYLCGDVYGWVAGDDSCWGYFGSDHKENGLLSAAQDAIDHKLSKMKTFVCSNCGGKNVWRDATAKWNEKTQEWEMVTVHDNADCEDCQCETTLVEKFVEDDNGKTD